MSAFEPTTASPSDPLSKRRGALRQWIIDHDDSWLFVIAYIGLAVVLSIWISLFWLVAVVAAHGVLEWVRHRHFDPQPSGVFVRVLWELKLDIALVILALVVTVYMEFILGIAGLSGAARVGLSSGARFAGWQRVIRGVLLSVDDAAQLGRAAVKGNASDANDAQPLVAGSIWGGWVGRWSLGDWISLSLTVLGITLLILCPWLTDHNFTTMSHEMLLELHPLPSSEVVTGTGLHD